MELEKITIDAFSVIGRLGSTNDGQGFIRRLWKDADMNFIQAREFAKKKEDGSLVGLWGLMSDFSMSFNPWEDNFSKGYYLAGFECLEDAIAPVGWTRWDVPKMTYFKVKNEDAKFSEVIEYFKENNIEMVAAAFDYTDTSDMKNYTLYPIERD